MVTLSILFCAMHVSQDCAQGKLLINLYVSSRCDKTNTFWCWV